MQFLPSHYFDYAVDYDGDGRRDLLNSAADALGSAGNFLSKLGWKRGEPWLTEVRVPQNLPWDQADLSIQHPRSQWAKLGVTLANGQPLPADDLKASLLLPMGRFGPAFLAYDNFQMFLKWNQSLVYSTTVGLSRQPHRRRPAGAARHPADRIARCQTASGTAEASGRTRFRAGQTRRQDGVRHQGGSQTGPNETRSAGGFLPKS